MANITVTALPEPMMPIDDIVHGHADDQAVEVLPQRFFEGPNMYGQDLNHQDPTVRAIARCSGRCAVAGVLRGWAKHR